MANEIEELTAAIQTIYRRTDPGSKVHVEENEQRFTLWVHAGAGHAWPWLPDASAVAFQCRVPYDQSERDNVVRRFLNDVLSVAIANGSKETSR